MRVRKKPTSRLLNLSIFILTPFSPFFFRYQSRLGGVLELHYHRGVSFRSVSSFSYLESLYFLLYLYFPFVTFDFDFIFNFGVLSFLVLNFIGFLSSILFVFAFVFLVTIRFFRSLENWAVTLKLSMNSINMKEKH